MADRTPRSEPHVVVGTDFSATSNAAVERALLVAKQSGAKLHVVHASGGLPAALARRFELDEERVEAELAAVVERARSAGVRATAHHVRTGPSNALRTLAREVGARLIVVGTRGRNLPDTFVGSTAERLATSSRVPVLLVRRAGAAAYRKVVVAVDMEPKLDACVQAGRFVSPAATLSILHAYEAPYETTLRLQGANAAAIATYRSDARREAKEHLLPLLELAGLEPSTLVLRHGDPRRLLHDMPRDTLLVMRRGSVVAHVFLGSVTRSVVGHGRSDVLIL